MAGLRQQQQHLTGKLGQMPSLIQQGGADGRGMLWHGGVNAKSGGTNAKGTGTMAAVGKTPAAPAPLGKAPAKGAAWTKGAGYFQYGDGQWGTITAGGLVDYTAKQPPKGAKVFGWNEVTPFLKARGSLGKVPAQKATPNPFIDPIYVRNMAQQDLALNSAVQGADYNVKMLDNEFKDERERSTREFERNREQMSAGLGGAGLDGSGIAAGSLGIASRDFGTFLDTLTDEHANKVAKERQDQGLARTAYDTTKASELDLAKDRWTLEHPTSKLPAVTKGVFQKAGQTYYTNPTTGVTTTFTPAKKATPAKPKAKVIGAIKKVK